MGVGLEDFAAVRTESAIAIGGSRFAATPDSGADACITSRITTSREKGLNTFVCEFPGQQPASGIVSGEFVADF